MKQFPYHIYGTADCLFPTETHFALFTLVDESIEEIPQQYPFSGPWGSIAVENVTIREEMPMPKSFEILYLSIVEETFYYLDIPINYQIMENVYNDLYKRTTITPFNLIVGMAPYGNISLWMGNNEKQILLGVLITSEIHLDMNEFLPERSDLTLKQYCNSYIDSDPLVKENYEKNGLPPRDLFERYMQQFQYRYIVEFGHWDEENEEWKPYEEDEVKPEFDYIEEALYDGTHDKLHDGELMKYHRAGKPKKLALQWHIKKSEYSAFLWMEDMKIRTAFEAFYHDYPEEEMDFCFRIDPQKNKYEILFNCQDAEQPIPLNESAYQMIVFKSKFEYHRSKNYNQPRGAWIW